MKDDSEGAVRILLFIITIQEYGLSLDPVCCVCLVPLLLSGFLFRLNLSRSSEIVRATVTLNPPKASPQYFPSKYYLFFR